MALTLLLLHNLQGLRIIVKGDRKGQYYSNKSNRQGQVDAEPSEGKPRHYISGMKGVSGKM